MAYDALSVLQASTTKTDTYSGEAYDLGTKGSALLTSLWARILATASNASGNATITFSIQHSDNSSSGFTTLSQADVITTTSTPTPYELFLPVSTSKRYIRVTATFSATTGTPTTTFSAEVGTSKP